MARAKADRHTIAGMALHMRYWKAAAATLAGRPQRYDDRQNWRAVSTTEVGWKDARTELERGHRRLMRVLGSLPRGRWLRKLHHRFRAIDFATDVATQDTYHAAQVFALRRLYRGRPR